ncbi:MAG: AraC family transcriptional regulator [Cyanobacteria bacterium P01_H01_bin.15]
MTSFEVDFAREKEQGYQRVFLRSPLLSSFSAQWHELMVAYDYFLAGQYPDVAAKQHSVAIFIDLPKFTSVTRKIGGERRCNRLVQGDLVIVPANTWHQAEPETSGGAIMVGIDPQEFTQFIDEAVECDGVELVPCFASTDPLVHQIGLALKRALENANQSSRLYAETLTNALMAHLIQHYCGNPFRLPTYTGGLSPLKLQQVVDYIHTHLSHDLALNELAEITQMSAHYFSELFKQSTGMSPHQYVIYCRIERAKQLLRETEFTIADVAKIVGFVDQSHFHRHFKRLVGVTPGKFLRQAK